MKRKYLPLLLTFPLLLTGCGNSQSGQAISSINSTLSQIEDIARQSQLEKIAPLTSNDTLELSSKGSIQGFKSTAYSHLQREQTMRQDILTLSGYIKSSTNKKLKLNKKQSNAILSITNDTRNYLIKLKDTKSALSNSVKEINKSLKNNEILSLEGAQSGYLALSNSMNARYAYMCNIYSNLESIYYLIEPCPVCKDNDTSENAPSHNKEIDNENLTHNIDTMTQNTTPHSSLPPPSTNGYYGNGYNNPYYNNHAFNPSRNTDSFYPRLKNIDTYRYNPNAYNGYNNYYNNYYRNNVPVV